MTVVLHSNGWGRMNRGGLTAAPWILLLFVVAGLAGIPEAGAQDGAEPILVDRIVAIVDEEIILASDLEREAELYKLEKEYAGETVGEITPEIRREMLERLIESKLIIAAAKQADLGVDEDAIRQSVEEKIQQFVGHFGSMEVLKQELLRSGMTLEDLENEVRDYYLAHLEEMPAEADSVTIADILVPVQPSLEVRQGIQTTIAAVNAELGKGRSFSELAKEYSKGPNAGRGGTIGTVSPGDLFDENLDRAAFSLSPGQVSEPIISSRGVHVLKLMALGEDGRRTLSQIFIPITVTDEDMALAKAEIDQARQRVINGEAFSLVAAEVSRDALSASRGGILGTFSLEDLSQQFQEALAEAATGQVTEPVLTPAGWYVFLVQDRKEGHMFTYEELREDLRQLVEGQEIELALSEYVAGLRERFFIDEKN
jgi:peptidyl-prolyl cis-trans isomerase SurA